MLANNMIIELNTNDNEIDILQNQVNLREIIICSVPKRLLSPKKKSHHTQLFVNKVHSVTAPKRKTLTLNMTYK